MLRLYPKADAVLLSKAGLSSLSSPPPPCSGEGPVLEHGPQVVCEHVKVGELGTEPIVMETTMVRRDPNTETALFKNERCGCCS